VVSVVDNPSKESMFTTEQRMAILEELFGSQVTVTSFSGLLVAHAVDQGADVVVKGLRSIDDYEYEKQMSQMNRHLSGMETVYMSTAAEYSFVSSSLVKEVAKLGGDVTALVPQAVARALKERLA
jgi:pantetheine-phosphate adenylyltransferase